MAYKTVRKAYGKGKRVYKFAKKHQSEGKQALALAKKVARMVNVEYKRDITTFNAAVGWTGTITNLCNPTQGDGVTNRDGDSLKLIRCSGRIYCTMNASATNTVVRVIMFRGKNENGTTYAPNDILYTTTGQMVFNPKEYTNRFQTKVLMDRTYSLSSTGKSNFYINVNQKLFGHINFETGGTGIENGGLYLLLVGSEQLNTPTVAYTLTTSFTDN